MKRAIGAAPTIDMILFTTTKNIIGGGAMAGFNYTLNRLLDLQGTDFEVIDCKVWDDKIVWRIVHRKGIYECPKCHAKLTSRSVFHNVSNVFLLNLPTDPKGVFVRL